MKVTFRGTRGSIARPGPDTLRYGGNTSCVELRGADGTLIVLDCGTGAWGLGRSLLTRPDGTRNGHLLIGHTHWDHIQGFPFFAPLFVPSWQWDVYAPGGLGVKLERSLAGQMRTEYFPLTLDALAAKVHYHDLVEGSLTLGGCEVTTRFLNHPSITLGYRVEAGGRSVVYSTDHEPHSPTWDNLDAPWRSTHREDHRHLAFLRGCDLLIHDTQYTEQEYRNDRVGWGHSPIERTVDMAMEGGVGTLALFHHDPARSDDDLDKILEGCKQRVSSAGSNLIVIGAAEGLTLDLEERKWPPTPPRSDVPSARTRASSVAETPRILVVDDDPAMLRLIQLRRARDGYDILCVANGEEALLELEQTPVHLLLLDFRLPQMDGRAVCRLVRAHANPQVRAVPVVMMTSEGRRGPDIEEGFRAGVTDYLLKPFKPSYLQSRVRGWLLRED